MNLNYPYSNVRARLVIFSILLISTLNCFSGTFTSGRTGLSVINSTVGGQLTTQVSLKNNTHQPISGSLSWKVVDSLNNIVQTVSRTLTIPPASSRYHAVQTFYMSLAPGIYRITCLFQNKLLNIRVGDESYYSNLPAVSLRVQAAKNPRVNYIIADVFKNISPQNQNLQGFIKDHLNTYLHARFNNASGNAVLATDMNGNGSRDLAVSVGSYLADASLVWKYTHDRQLKRQIDSIAYTFTHTQEADGYLGIRTSSSYWVLSDINTLKNNINGLLTYYQICGYKPALASCLLAANLVTSTFSSPEGNKALFSIGKLSASSIIGPMLDLYLQTGDTRYLNFCMITLKEMEEPGEPHLITGLSAAANFDLTDTPMEDVLANLIAILKIYRVTGNDLYLVPCNSAWQGIISDPELLSISQDKMINLDVMNLWTQFNAQFALSTGEVSYFNQVDKSLYLHKSSALLPYFPLGVIDNHPVIINYETGDFKEEILSYDGSTMTLNVTQTSDFPNQGRVSLIVNPSRSASFTLSLRRPARSVYYKAIIAGKIYTVLPNHFLNIQRFWKKGDLIDIQFEMLAPYLTDSQENEAYQKEQADQTAVDKSIRVRRQIRRSW